MFLANVRAYLTISFVFVTDATGSNCGTLSERVYQRHLLPKYQQARLRYYHFRHRGHPSSTSGFSPSSSLATIHLTEANRRTISPFYASNTIHPHQIFPRARRTLMFKASQMVCLCPLWNQDTLALHTCIAMMYLFYLLSFISNNIDPKTTTKKSFSPAVTMFIHKRQATLFCVRNTGAIVDTSMPYLPTPTAYIIFHPTLHC